MSIYDRIERAEAHLKRLEDAAGDPDIVGRDILNADIAASKRAVKRLHKQEMDDADALDRIGAEFFEGLRQANEDIWEGRLDGKTDEELGA